MIPKPNEADWSRPYVLGNGDKRALCWKFKWDQSASILSLFPAFEWRSFIKLIQERLTVSGSNPIVLDHLAHGLHKGGLLASLFINFTGSVEYKIV